MMKRLLPLLAALLAIASPVDAGLWLAVDEVHQPPASEITLDISQSAVISIWGDIMLPPYPGWAAAGYILVEGPASIDGCTILWPGDLVAYWDLEEIAENSDPQMTPEECLQAFRDYLDMPDITDVSNWYLVDSSLSFLPLVGKLIDDIVFHCEGPGDVTMTLIFNDFTTVFDTLTIHQIPEPATLALLGLGGLFLMRRRK
ncbi:MAG: PEP-CTERM sorting domain-containing protein [Planctomycetota bacterium]|jgi:hypothetical protein